MRKSMTAAAIFVACVAPALAAESAAEYYVALDSSTNECRVVAQEPDGKTMTMVGGGAYDTEAEAEEAMQSLTLCGR